MNKKYKMAWTKAQNPYKAIKNSPIEDELYEEDIPPQDDEFDEVLAEEIEHHKQKDGVGQVDALFTPLGIIVLDEYTDTYRLFNFWIAHTNFDLTKGVRKVIEDTPGVEILHVFTRYRFRIAVARYWKPSEVFVAIQKNVVKYLNQRERMLKIRKAAQNESTE